MLRDIDLFSIYAQLQQSSKNDFVSDISDCIDPDLASEGDSDIDVNPCSLYSHTHIEEQFNAE